MSLLAAIFLLVLILAVGLPVFLYIWTQRLARMGENLVPQAGEVIPVRGGGIHYVEMGNPRKQTLVMIHGLSGQLQHFTYALAQDLARDHHVIALDRPGCGYSPRDHDALADLPEQARMIGEFLDKKGITDAVLVGHSLGGAVSLAIALQRPREIAALALICPLTHPMDSAAPAFKPLEIRSPRVRRWIGNTLAVPMGKRNAAETLQMVFAPESCPEDFLEKAGGALGLRPQAFVTASADLVWAEQSIRDQASQYAHLSTPGGILFGAQDPIVSAHDHGASMKKYGLSHQVLEGRGHMIPITDPEACSEFIRSISVMARIPATLVK
ncbi:Dihydrolipoyllysine-residue acetyltransferase component of acetoin cleaving system [Falsiruegeria litorea R37]|uniref:Dihydrolipoyllysine-residue acetyltransferase component of acetoin cleaving system n=1 Tax=Falsiruegeria litorea R37 TaxID=1200284 RepID=A0A1Y5RRD4_9RHOB|nr:alpha/beta fold hydrolase [Falsiruegeria litorea]SLN22496.1 Dihydrolipoyllysine-residue acetyltransferase component of acetoin cleaving system [Falsiruegeria litorea R37]